MDQTFAESEQTNLTAVGNAWKIKRSVGWFKIRGKIAATINVLIAQNS